MIFNKDIVRYHHGHDHGDGCGCDHHHAHNHSHTHADGTVHSHDHDHAHSHSHGGGHDHDHGCECGHHHGEVENKDEKTLNILLVHWVNHNQSHEEGFQEWVEKAKAMGKTETAACIEKAIEYMQKANDMLLEAKKNM